MAFSGILLNVFKCIIPEYARVASIFAISYDDNINLADIARCALPGTAHRFVKPRCRHFLSIFNVMFLLFSISICIGRLFNNFLMEVTDNSGIHEHSLRLGDAFELI